VKGKVICEHERKKFVIVGSFITVPASAQRGNLEFRKTLLETKRIFHYLDYLKQYKNSLCGMSVELYSQK